MKGLDMNYKDTVRNRRIPIAERHQMYLDGDYTMKPPDVYSGNWDNTAWVNHITHNGQFIKKKKEKK